MRNDQQFQPLSIINQINNIDEIGVTHFFKAYKRTKKTLSGDFHIGAKHTFDKIKNHKDFKTWFHLHGYNVFLNSYSCQTSDMVRIGFLSRLHHLLTVIIYVPTSWMSNSHFRLYFDTFSTNAKGTMTYVLMVDVDRPSIKIGLEFFQKCLTRTLMTIQIS